MFGSSRCRLREDVRGASRNKGDLARVDIQDGDVSGWGVIKEPLGCISRAD